jgi:hypothetical protein
VATGVGPAAGWQGPDRQQRQLAFKMLTSACWLTSENYGIIRKNHYVSVCGLQQKSGICFLRKMNAVDFLVSCSAKMGHLL